MNHTKLILVILAVSLLAAFMLAPQGARSLEKPAAEEKKPELTHAQTVWLYALEWCESKGNVEAINPNDLDNTPSYYSFQFKPGTFRYYGEKYGVIEKGLSDAAIMELMKKYELQHAIVTQMVLHRSEINWSQQFPWCTKKLGYPPLPHPAETTSPLQK